MDYAFNLGDDFGDVMRHQQDPQARLSEFAHSFAELHLRGDVEGVAGFVEEQRLRIVDEGAGD